MKFCTCSQPASTGNRPAQVPLRPGVTWKWDPFWDGLDELERGQEIGAPKPQPEACRLCGKELCRELDAYYGRDPEQAKRCDRCRRQR